MNEIYFNCHMCGKCCNSSPGLIFEEIFTFSNDFPIELSLQVLPLGKDLNLLKKSEDFYNLVYFSGNPYSIILVPRTNFIRSLKKCQKLENNLCTLQDKKPTTCKSVPFSFGSLEEQQPIVFKQKDNLFIKEQCISLKKKENFTKIYDNNHISELNFSNNFSTYRNSLKNNKSNVLNFIKFCNINIQPNLSIIINPTLYLLFLNQTQTLTKDNAFDFIQKQNKLNSQMIDDSIKLKSNDKNDKETTNLLRNFIKENTILEKNFK